MMMMRDDDDDVMMMMCSDEIKLCAFKPHRGGRFIYTRRKTATAVTFFFFCSIFRILRHSALTAVSFLLSP